jgi:hypothetical protein
LKNIVHPKSQDVEIDLICDSPPIIVEVKYKIIKIEKFESFLKKIHFLEQEIFHQKADRFFCAIEVDRSIYGELMTRAESENVRVITKNIT